MKDNNRNRRDGFKKVLKKRGEAGVFSPLRKRFCRFCLDKTRKLDYKEVKSLEAFIRERGKIGSTRSSGNCAKHQRVLTLAIKRARFLSLLPYTQA